MLNRCSRVSFGDYRVIGGVRLELIDSYSAEYNEQKIARNRARLATSKAEAKEDGWTRLRVVKNAQGAMALYGLRPNAQ